MMYLMENVNDVLNGKHVYTKMLMTGLTMWEAVC